MRVSFVAEPVKLRPSAPGRLQLEQGMWLRLSAAPRGVLHDCGVWNEPNARARVAGLAVIKRFSSKFHILFRYKLYKTVKRSL